MVKSLPVRHLQNRTAKSPVTVDASSSSDDLRFFSGLLRSTMLENQRSSSSFTLLAVTILCYKGLAHLLVIAVARAEQLAECLRTLDLFPSLGRYYALMHLEILK